MATIPRSIDEDEKLGRHEWSRSIAKKVYGRLARGEAPRPPASKFKPPDGSCELSVDRMNFVDQRELAKLAEKNSTRNDPSLRGWYTLKAGDVAEAKCTVQGSPLEGNPYHADIILPVNVSAVDSRDDLMEYARNLAYLADFEPWGDWQYDDSAEYPNQPLPEPATDPADPD